MSDLQFNLDLLLDFDGLEAHTIYKVFQISKKAKQNIVALSCISAYY